MLERINLYYQQCGIHPLNFHCPFQAFCRGHADRNLGMTETKMSMVGAKYEITYPKIVVVSLDPPNGGATPAEQRTIEAVSALEAARNFMVNRPNPHWGMTQIIVKDILALYGYQAQPSAAIVPDSYAAPRFVENVSNRFAHINLAKCSMNNAGKGQAHRAVHRQCGDAHLVGELALLQPDILITQGAAANDVTSQLLTGQAFSGKDLPATRIVHIGRKKVLWLLMRHPARSLGKIRKDWPVYVQVLRSTLPTATRP